MQLRPIHKLLACAVLAQLVAYAGVLLVQHGWIVTGRAIVFGAVAANILLVLGGVKIAYVELRHKIRNRNLGNKVS